MKKIIVPYGESRNRGSNDIPLVDRGVRRRVGGWAVAHHEYLENVLY
jgi:hypothetical protein